MVESAPAEGEGAPLTPPMRTRVPRVVSMPNSVVEEAPAALFE